MYTYPLLLFCASSLALTSSKPFYDLKNAEHLFEQFIQKHNRLYAGEEEKRMRLEIFKQSLEKINRRNMMIDEHATFGIDNFADVTSDEMKSYTGLLPTTIDCTCLTLKQQGHKCPKEVLTTPCENLVLGDGTISSSGSLPDSFDWREKNVVSDVKNQDGCGSCWTFSTTGNIESQYAIKHGKIVTFSEQQLIDCNKLNHGCAGGALNISFWDLLEKGGLMTESDYPYEAKDGKCRFDVSKAKAKLTKCYSLDLQDEEKLKEYLHKTGPISIAIDASDINGYEKGVLRHCHLTKLDHAVLLVGYGIGGGLMFRLSGDGTSIHHLPNWAMQSLKDSVPYWTIKNSWGAGWGEKGYVRVERGKNSCGMMNSCAVTSVVA